MIRERVTTVIRRTRPELLRAAAVRLVLVAALLAYVLVGGSGSHQAQTDSAGRRILYWYDPMVPQEHYPGPGKSSMNMDLVPKYADESAQGGVTVSPTVMQSRFSQASTPLRRRSSCSTPRRCSRSRTSGRRRR